MGYKQQHRSQGFDRSNSRTYIESWPANDQQLCARTRKAPGHACTAQRPSKRLRRINHGGLRAPAHAPRRVPRRTHATSTTREVGRCEPLGEDLQRRLLAIGNAAKARNPDGFVDELKRRVGPSDGDDDDLKTVAAPAAPPEPAASWFCLEPGTRLEKALAHGDTEQHAACGRRPRRR